jgi:ribosomal protein L4
MQVDILNIAGAKTGRTIELPEEIFGAEPNTHVVYLAVIYVVLYTKVVVPSLDQNLTSTILN